MRGEAPHTSYDETSPGYALQPGRPNHFRLPATRRMLRLGCITESMPDGADLVREIDPKTGTVVMAEHYRPEQHAAA